MPKRHRVRDAAKAREYQRRFRELRREHNRERQRQWYQRKGRFSKRALREPKTLAELAAARRWGRPWPAAAKLEAHAERMRHHREWVDAVLTVAWQDQRGSERVQRASPARG